MSKEWIENLAEHLKEKGREPAETYAREQHQSGIIETKGKVFFTELVLCLEQDFSELRAKLQGSAISSDTSILRVSPTQIKLTRSRFPWFDAVLKHEERNLTLEYAQGRGVPGEETLDNTGDRHVISYGFQVDGRDSLSIGSEFEDAAVRFHEPEELAKKIMTLLLNV